MRQYQEFWCHISLIAWVYQAVYVNYTNQSLRRLTFWILLLWEDYLSTIIMMDKQHNVYLPTLSDFIRVMSPLYLPKLTEAPSAVVETTPYLYLSSESLTLFSKMLSIDFGIPPLTFRTKTNSFSISVFRASEPITQNRKRICWAKE